MKRSQALHLLRGQQKMLSEHYHMAALSIFGSVARDEAHPGSDIDILVEFSQPAGLFHFIDLQPVAFEFTTIGEAARVIPQEIQEHYSDIP